MTDMVHRPAVHPVVAAIVAALRADVATQALLHERPVAPVGTAKRVYAIGAVPAALTGRWVEVGGPSEAWSPTFMRGGSRVGLLVHLWYTPIDGDDISATTVYRLWGVVAPALSPKLVLAAPHLMLAGTPSLIDVGRDADNVSWHGIVRYDAITQDRT